MRQVFPLAEAFRLWDQRNLQFNSNVQKTKNVSVDLLEVDDLMESSSRCELSDAVTQGRTE